MVCTTLLTNKHTHTEIKRDREADRETETDSFWPAILLAQPAELKLPLVLVLQSL